MRRELADTVEWARVESIGAVRLGLESDPNMLDWTGEDGVGDAGESTSGIVLRIGQIWLPILCGVGCLESTTDVMEASELYRYLY